MAKWPWAEAKELRPAVQKENFCPWFQIRICSKIKPTLYWPKSNLGSFWSFLKSDEDEDLLKMRLMFMSDQSPNCKNSKLQKQIEYKYKYNSVRQDELRVSSVIEALTFWGTLLWKLWWDSHTHTRANAIAVQCTILLTVLKSILPW